MLFPVVQRSACLFVRMVVRESCQITVSGESRARNVGVAIGSDGTKEALFVGQYLYN